MTFHRVEVDYFRSAPEWELSPVYSSSRSCKWLHSTSETLSFAEITVPTRERNGCLDDASSRQRLPGRLR